MLFKRWNKNGSFVNCEASQLEEMEKNGYNLEKCPEVEIKEDVKKTTKKKKESDFLKNKPESKKTTEPKVEKETKPEIGIILE